MGIEDYKRAAACPMGLHPHGAFGGKRLLLWLSSTQNGHACAHRPGRTKRECRDADGAVRDQCVVIVDGTVLLKAIPARLQTFDELVQHFCAYLADALETARHVIVVLDDSQHVTRAKYEEQSRRDSSQTKKKVVCSEDLEQTPTTDDYDLATLRELSTLRPMLKDFRATRNRAYDAIMMAAFTHVTSTLHAHDPTGETFSLTLDGVDPRGADRPIGAPRHAQVLFSHAYVQTALWPRKYARDQLAPGRGSEPLGEGDVKLPDWIARYEAFAWMSSALVHCNYFLVETNDSDSFLIELLGEAARRHYRDEDVRTGWEEMDVNGVLTDARPPASEFTVVLALLQTNPSKIDPNRAKRDDAAEEQRQVEVEQSTSSRYCFVHMGLFYEHLVRRIGVAHLDAEQRLHACALLAATVALCGCDFVQKGALRTDRAIEALRCALACPPEQQRALLRSAGRMLCPSAGAPDAECEEILGGRKSLRHVVDLAAANLADEPGARASAVTAARDCTDTLLMRSAWVVAYWAGHERRDVETFGFLPPKSADARPTEPVIVSCV